MAQLAPPPLPPTDMVRIDNDGMRPLARRMRLVLLSLLIILATAWCFTLGIVPGVLAAMVAKHILVAILVMELGVDKQENGQFASEAAELHSRF